jgi:hypothetical protein
MSIIDGLTAVETKFHFSPHPREHTHRYGSASINCHNCRIWGSENPHALMEHVRYSSKANVWCGITSDQIVGPCFFHEITTTSAVYLYMLEKFVFPQIVAEVDGLIFQQYGVPAHFGAIVRTALNEGFPGGWICRGGPINWPHRVLT